MFAERRQRRELQHDIALVRKTAKEGVDLQSLDPLLTHDESEIKIVNEAKPGSLLRELRLAEALQYRVMKLEQFESDVLINEARKLAVEIPLKHSDWWIDDEDEGNVTGTRWLSPTGQIAVSKLIKEERRKNIEWWVKIITPLLVS